MDGQVRRVMQYKVYLSDVLGQGSFGTVLKGYDEKEKRSIAVKMVKLSQLIQDGECMYGNEIETLCSLKGTHIVKLLDALEDEFNLYLFFEYCEGGDLETLLQKKIFLSEKDACSILKQITKAFLDQDQHQETDGKRISMMHRDIKPANILFHEGKVKVADFGMAKFINYFEKNKKKRYEFCGTIYYLAPQLLNMEDYSAKCDIWSAGVLFYEILIGRLPFNGRTERDIYCAIHKGLNFPKNVGAEVRDLISKMLRIREEERISWVEVWFHSALDEKRFEPKIPKDDYNVVHRQIMNGTSKTEKYFDNQAPIPYMTRYNVKPEYERPDYNDYKPRPFEAKGYAGYLDRKH